MPPVQLWNLAWGQIWLNCHVVEKIEWSIFAHESRGPKPLLKVPNGEGLQNLLLEVVSMCQKVVNKCSESKEVVSKD